MKLVNKEHQLLCLLVDGRTIIIGIDEDNSKMGGNGELQNTREREVRD